MESPVKKIREGTFGVIQEDFADMAGVSQSYLSKVETGRVEINPALRSFLQRISSIDVDDVAEKQIKYIQERKKRLLSEAQAVLAVQENRN